MTAAIRPLSATETLVISRPRALTASSASANGRAPAATSAAYSPRLCPITTSGTTPYAARSLVRAVSTANTAGLGDGRLPEMLLRLRHGARFRRVDEHVIGEGLAEQRRHDPIGLGEDLLHHGLGGGQILQHVHVLRALTGVEERDLRRGSLAQEQPLAAQRFPRDRVVAGERLLGAIDLGGELRGVAMVDGEAHRCTQVRLGGRRERGGASGGGRGADRGEPREQVGPRRGADDESAA
jgi:hypothetical protein